MAGTNTEKPTSKDERPSEKGKSSVQNTSKSKKEIQKQNQQKVPQEKTQENKEEKTENTQTKETEKKTTEKQESKTKKNKSTEKSKPKKSEARVNAKDTPLSTKVSAAICKFIKNKEIKKAVEELNQVIEKKKPIPMKGEYPHQKGIMSGKYPVKAAKEFRTLLRSLGANAVENGLEKPVISVAVSNKGQKPMAKFGMWERKRTHITLVAKEGTKSNTNKTKKNKK